MPNFILDNTDLPREKSEGSGTSAAFLSGAEFNTIRQALLDTRTVVRAGGYFGEELMDVEFAGEEYLLTDALGQLNWEGITDLLADLGAGALSPSSDITSSDSTTGRPLNERFAEVRNVKDFGAVGDGVTNDTAAFTLAIAAGQVVTVPGENNETYYLPGGITIPADSSSLDAPSFHMYGIGRPTLLLNAASGAALISQNKRRFVTIENFRLKSNGSEDDGYNTRGIQFIANTSRQTLRNIRAENFSQAGIRQIQGLYHHYYDIDINNCDTGISLEKDGSTVPTTTNIRDAYITSCRRGLYAENLVDSLFDGLAFESCGSSSTENGALHCTAGCRRISAKVYFENNQRNMVLLNARLSFYELDVITAGAAADVITQSSITSTDRGLTQIRNNHVKTHYLLPDDLAGLDLIIGSHITVPANGTAPTIIAADLTSTIYRSGGSNIAASGVFRLANAELIAWRNAANSASLAVRVNSSDRLQFNSVDIPTISSTDTFTNKTLSGATLSGTIGGTSDITAATFRSSSSNIAASGVFRLANNENVSWRNNANSASLSLRANTSDRLQFDGVTIPTISSTDTLTNKTLTTPTISSEAWSTPTFVNSWVDFGGAYASCQYRKIANGDVVFKGAVKSGTSGTATICTLPAGYRPAGTVSRVTSSNGAIILVTVTSAGVVAAINSTTENASATEIVLDGIQFPTN